MKIVLSKKELKMIKSALGYIISEFTAIKRCDPSHKMLDSLHEEDVKLYNKINDYL